MFFETNSSNHFYEERILYPGNLPIFSSLISDDFIIQYILYGVVNVYSFEITGTSYYS